MTTFDANKFFQDDNSSLETPTPTNNLATDGLPIEVMNYVNDHNQQKETEAN